MKLSADDYEQIRQLLARYTQSADRRDADAVLSCYTEDATFFMGAADQAPPELTFSGPDRIRELILGGAEENVVTQHWLSEVRIEGTEDGATSEVYVMILRIPAGEPATIMVTAVYRDVLSREADGWRVARREFIPNP